MNRQLYALKDVNKKESDGMFPITLTDAPRLNARGYGIFWTVNDFNGPRQIVNLRKINSWALEIDGDDKASMVALLKSGLLPSLVIETKRGYHVYWDAKDAVKEHWNNIVLDRLVPFYGADPNARDIARVLRYPGYLHQKDPLNPFKIRVVWEYDVSYCESEMMAYYDSANKPKNESRSYQSKSSNQWRRVYGAFWDRVSSLNCEDALKRLSSSEHVNGEQFGFKKNASGTKNIHVNGKPTSCWIDNDGRIGSFDKGGPTIAQWLNWYHSDMNKVIEIIKKEFPECNETMIIMKK